ncbi:hypothetical protein B0O80DRAFT_451151 [Mortierella sp. GBAus27b]|nr:hypothetical protein B0O80DRAFT_451151 [Mortierella sp. GBAus27b]
MIRKAGTRIKTRVWIWTLRRMQQLKRRTKMPAKRRTQRSVERLVIQVKWDQTLPRQEMLISSNSNRRPQQESQTLHHLANRALAHGPLSRRALVRTALVLALGHHTDRGHDLLVGTAQHPTTTDETEIAIKHEQMTEVAEGTRGNVLADIAAQVETAITMALQPVGEVLHRILVAGIMIVGRDTGVVVPAVVRVDVDLARIVVAVVVEVQDDHEWIVGNAKATRIH